jgi:hypothetical protein
MPPELANALNPWRNIPGRILFIFLAAVFFTFSAMGFLGDIAGMGLQSPIRFGGGVALSGIFAIFYAYGGIALRGQFWKAFLPLFALQVAAMTLLTNWFPDAPRPMQTNAAETARLQSRLNFDTGAITVVVFLGYAGFVFVFVSESRRHIRVHTEKAVLESEMQAAREIQQMILPGSGESFSGYRVDSVYAPAQQVGGDFFQILTDGAGGILLVLGDVAGKGLPAAMLVSMLVGSIRTVAEETAEPAQILRALHERLIGRTRGGFSTALAARIAQDGQVRIANAGHLAPYLDGKEVALPGALPLGVTGGGECEEMSLTLAPGSRLTFYTDGVVEAQNSNRELFGFDRTQAISTETAAAIVEAAVHFGQSDDITVVTIERLPA